MVQAWWLCLTLPPKDHPHMTFAVDWALKNNYLSIYHQRWDTLITDLVITSPALPPRERQACLTVPPKVWQACWLCLQLYQWGWDRLVDFVSNFTSEGGTGLLIMSPTTKGETGLFIGKSNSANSLVILKLTLLQFNGCHCVRMVIDISFYVPLLAYKSVFK